MLTLRKLLALLNACRLDEIYKEARRYGTIVQDNSWTMADPPSFAGEWRRLRINHHGRAWEFTLHNGSITEAGLLKRTPARAMRVA